MEGDRTYLTLNKRRLTFRGNMHTGLGYANRSTIGSAVGPDMAENLEATGQAIAKAGSDAPEIFELVGLLEPKIGPARISDMTVAIIQPRLLALPKAEEQVRFWLP